MTADAAQDVGCVCVYVDGCRINFCPETVIEVVVADLASARRLSPVVFADRCRTNQQTSVCGGTVCVCARTWIRYRFLNTLNTTDFHTIQLAERLAAARQEVISRTLGRNPRPH